MYFPTPLYYVLPQHTVQVRKYIGEEVGRSCPNHIYTNVGLIYWLSDIFADNDISVLANCTCLCKYIGIGKNIVCENISVLAGPILVQP